MRLVRFVQFGLEVAAAGAVVAFLGGSALAADSGLGSVTQSPAVQANVPNDPSNGAVTVPQGDQTPPAVSAQQNIQDTDGTGTSVGNGVGSTLKFRKSKLSENVTGQQAQTSTDSSSTSVSASSNNSNDSGLNSGASVTGGSGSDSSGTGAVSDNSNKDKNAAGLAETQKPQTASDSAYATEDTSSKPVVPALTTVTYHSTVLSIRPMITNRQIVPTDLAASMPSAPEPAKAPMPAKSNGALGKLTAVLAGIVVPQVLQPVAGMPHTLGMPGLMILVLMIAAVFTFNYGAWLRLGGFATAARSDAPTQKFSSPFATPLSLGYVRTPFRQLHSPILLPVVYEILKPNRFPALSERRIYA